MPGVRPAGIGEPAGTSLAAVFPVANRRGRTPRPARICYKAPVAHLPPRRSPAMRLLPCLALSALLNAYNRRIAIVER